ncbi:MAG: hypothetical protein HY961_09690, partial [Ignavibacteriae bacterium]|nr:hypothetical protein [Ignavibacteriota bacterium]
MRKFTRREFGKSITSSVAASLVVAPELLSQHAAEQPEDNSAPDVIAGYKLTEEYLSRI